MKWWDSSKKYSYYIDLLLSLMNTGRFALNMHVVTGRQWKVSSADCRLALQQYTDPGSKVTLLQGYPTRTAVTHTAAQHSAQRPHRVRAHLPREESDSLVCIAGYLAELSIFPQ